MKVSKRLHTATTNASSMADIAFLLLIFFMVTTTISNDQGLDLQLPPYLEEDKPIVEIHERNLYKILINTDNAVFAEGEVVTDLPLMRTQITQFILNNGKNPNYSDSPKEAVVSIKTNRGTSQERFVDVLDEVKAAYYTIYAERLGVEPEVVRNISNDNIKLKRQYKELKASIPMNISIAEPQQ
ncbi:biopolymer transporter ExbD [Fulvivirga sp. RKSG066]|uniref:ExbD/TolR family protein n=1 Tax=Fulvivirga aurantia TaxID=2529383 RepID=UPI0012BCC93A|nr:biopolymer transporter ExbD [Fulvivirga aurantia]MTI22817.1 biopolymer transporter ExbD [Fulvivirga aurantia]